MTILRAPRVAVPALLVSLAVVACSGSVSTTDDRSAPGGRGPSRGAEVWVDPAGDDGAGGGERAPLRTIQAALDRAAPGTTVHLAAGDYHERPVTRVAGTAQAPITVIGPESGTDTTSRHRATLYGTGRVMNVRHSHYVLRGFTIDGQEAVERRVPLVDWPTDPDEALAFKKSVRDDVRAGRLVYVEGEEHRAVTGTLVDDMYLVGGGECVRFREGADHATVRDSVIAWCGMNPSSSTHGGEYHNGEGVYVGTSPKSRSLAGHEDDRSGHVAVLRTTITTFGSECVDVKENAHHVLVDDVRCSGNLEPAADAGGSGIEVRGWASTVRDTRVEAGPGFGVKIAADSSRYRSGGNSVVGTTLLNDGEAPIQVRSEQRQGVICGNSAPKDPAALPAPWSAGCP